MKNSLLKSLSIRKWTHVSNLSAALMLAELNRREITAEAKKVFRRLIGEKHNVSNFVPKDFKLVVFHEQEIRSVEKKVFRRLKFRR